MQCIEGNAIKTIWCCVNFAKYALNYYYSFNALLKHKLQIEFILFALFYEHSTNDIDRPNRGT